ncbi:hypothetical protein BpHYR1_045910 [Brachionus plicatilis]|uniref:Uncharacterized protein n=1 Tax=Brachionus plicatilis TaxID=10195 RepID=A0A3M7S7L9_BRAPC|nr:hypothetical protein BpHYR1_045910 [Brachionus plicatilis]
MKTLGSDEIDSVEFDNQLVSRYPKSLSFILILILILIFINGGQIYLPTITVHKTQLKRPVDIIMT